MSGLDLKSMMPMSFMATIKPGVCMKFRLLFFLVLFSAFSSVFSISLQTDRLLLRFMTTEDAEEVFEFTSDPEVCKLSALFRLHTSIEETREYIQRELSLFAQGTSILWVIVYKPHNKVIGVVNIYSLNYRHSKAEISYALARNYWGQGIAAEASRLVLDYGFNTLGLHRIQAMYDPRNAASGRVLGKLGFTFEGLLRDYFYGHNEFCDRVMVSLLKSEFIRI